MSAKSNLKKNKKKSSRPKLSEALPTSVSYKELLTVRVNCNEAASKKTFAKRNSQIFLKNNISPRFFQSDRSRLQHKFNILKRPKEKKFVENKRNSIHKPTVTAKLPLPSVVAASLYSSHFSAYEQEEILGYSQVYYIGNSSWRYKLKGPNKGCDDSKGRLLFFRGDHIAFRYSIIGILGRGTFGTVCKAFDHKEQELVAIKVTRNRKEYQEQSKMEVQVLEALLDWDIPNKYPIVKMKNHFSFRNHECIVFELLDKSLYEALKLRNFKGFPLQNIRHLMRQVLEVLVYMKDLEIIHCDLKPENLLFTDGNENNVKVIDFGSSCHSYSKIHDYIQSRYYRAPEVMLCLPYSTAIDIWSFGCILYELRRGIPLFTGNSEAEQLQLIVETLGQPPKEMVCASRKKIEACSQKKQRTIDKLLEREDVEFVDLIKRCLKWVPKKRITPVRALEHPFFLEPN